MARGQPENAMGDSPSNAICIDDEMTSLTIKAEVMALDNEADTIRRIVIPDDDEDDNEVTFIREIKPGATNATSPLPHGYIHQHTATNHFGVKLIVGGNFKLLDGGFIRVEQIVQDRSTDATYVRGKLMRRCSGADDMLQKKMNELYIISYIKSGKKLPDTSTIPIDKIFSECEIILTNELFPHCSFREDIKNYYKDIQEDCVLVCRWNMILELDDKKSKVLEYDVLRLTEEECDHGRGVGDLRLRRQWRGNPAENVPKKRPHDFAAGGSDDQDSEVQEIASMEIPTRADRKSTSRTAHVFTAARRASVRDGMHRQTPRRRTYGDLFSGGGGTVSGAKMAGLEISFVLDHDEKCCKSLKLNFCNTEVHAKVLHMDIFDFCTCNVAGVCTIVDILHISPPCQPHSPAHTRPGAKDDDNIAAGLSVIPILKKSRPCVVTFEQTAGLVTHNGGHHFRALVHQLTSLNYSVRAKILNLAEYGAPQKRMRLIVIAAAPGETPPKFPPQTHGHGPGLKPFVVVNQAISNITPHVTLHDPAKLAREFKGSVKPIADGNMPLQNLIATNGVQALHPSGRRYFTVREQMRLQTFPDSHKLYGENKGDYMRQIGNAVPSVFAKTLFEHIAKCLDESDQKAAAWRPPQVDLTED